MPTVQLPEPTYHLLKERAAAEAISPDALADAVLRRELLPTHPYVELASFAGGPSAVVKGTRVPVSIIVSYLQQGQTPESLVAEVLPRLTLAQVYDALSYAADHQAEIERERAENTEEAAQARLRNRLGDEAYRRLAGPAV